MSRDALLISDGMGASSPCINETTDDELWFTVPSAPPLEFIDSAMLTENAAVRRWFGQSFKCLESERICRPYIEYIVKEPCYYILPTNDSFSESSRDCELKERFLRQLLGDGLAGCEKTSFEARDKTSLRVKPSNVNQFIVEIGPKLRHSTPWCTNVLNVCCNTGVTLERIEKTWRYLVSMTDSSATYGDKEKVKSLLYDDILEEIYEEPLLTFYDSLPQVPLTWEEIPVIQLGRRALEEENLKNEFGFDEADLNYYNHLFEYVLKRNPTNVELCDLAQSNSEHSRHWFFRGTYELDGNLLPRSLMEMVKNTNGPTTAQNNVIKFHDNSSAITGFLVPVIEASNPTEMSQLKFVKRLKHLLLTAETHNFPTGVAPFSGATTGTGGRIRDVMAAGRGGCVLAATAGYAVGQLHLRGYEMPWETDENYNGFFQSPQKIIIEASNGASDYGNKFGEPVIGGFFRSYGGRVDKERREWLKPIMFSAGIGLLDEMHSEKSRIDVEQDIHIAKIGGPAYRIGIGGGSASSVLIQGTPTDRTLQAVQRGDPEMGNKLNRLLRGCIEMAENNPILSIHDQGAGGNANVLKEIVDGNGADVYAQEFTLGDNSLSLKELWCAEYQESNAILFKRRTESILKDLSKRERCNVDVVGEIVDSKRFRFIHCDAAHLKHNEGVPVDFPIGTVLDEIPMKKYIWTSAREKSTALSLAEVNTKEAALRILKLPSVASKRFLTSKVDRSVTGLIAQQQCVGSLQLPLSDLAVTACSYFSTEGIATSIGEQPIMTLVDPVAGARMSLMEALASIVMTPISRLKDIKCSVNWIWPAKLKGEGYAMYLACEGICDLMQCVGVAADGGKDSLSMAAQTIKPDNTADEIVKAPGNVVVSAYAPCIDITKVVTPDIKGISRNVDTKLLWIRPVEALKGRLGGSAFAQVFSQLGIETPNYTNEDANIFIVAFSVMQKLIKADKILSCHDISEGGFFVCLVEMCMAGNCGAKVKLPKFEDQESSFKQGDDDASYSASLLFSEEIGWLLEAKTADLQDIMDEFHFCHIFDVGTPTINLEVLIEDFKEELLSFSLSKLRESWEETSFRLDLLQTNTDCVLQEYKEISDCCTPHSYVIGFKYRDVPMDIGSTINDLTPSVAVIREEGTNGDRELAAAFMMAGFYVQDIAMTDLFDKRIDLRRFRGLAFPGGFSYADSLGAAVGWAAGIRGNDYARNIIAEWRMKKNNFSLAVCNGCQLTALLGWQEVDDMNSIYCQESPPKVQYEVNLSNRFESRWCRMKIGKSDSFFLKDMEGSVLGVWVAHKEGRFTCDEETYDLLEMEGRLPIKYANYKNSTTEDYPHNPNGSRNGVAGVVSRCGRHLALMPHPERCFLPWQCPDKSVHPASLSSSFNSEEVPTAPWAKLFQNSYDWCVKVEERERKGEDSEEECVDSEEDLR